MKEHSELSIKIPMLTMRLYYSAVYVHQRNLQYLITEIYNIKDSLNPSFMKKLFELMDLQYDVRNKAPFTLERIQTGTDPRWIRSNFC